MTKLPPIILNKIIYYLMATVPNFPNIDGRTYTYDYSSDIKIISITWQRNYFISEDEGNLVFDYDEAHNMIGVEILHFDLEEFLRTGEIPR